MLNTETIQDSIIGLEAIEDLLTQAQLLSTHDPIALSKARAAYHDLCESTATLLRDECEAELVNYPDGRKLLQRANSLVAANAVHGITTTQFVP